MKEMIEFYNSSVFHKILRRKCLNENDIDDIVKARVSQETDMGMTLTDEYVDAYRNVMLKLFKENTSIPLSSEIVGIPVLLK